MSLPGPAHASFANSWNRWFDGTNSDTYSDNDQGKAVLYDPATRSLVAWGRRDDRGGIGGLQHWLAFLKPSDGSMSTGAPWTQTGAFPLPACDLGGVFPRGGLAADPRGFLYAAGEHNAHGGDIRIFRFDLRHGTTQTLTISGPGSCADASQELVFDSTSGVVFAAGFIGDCSSGTFSARSWTARLSPDFSSFLASTGSVATTGWPNRIKVDSSGRLFANAFTGQAAGTVRLQELGKADLSVISTFTFRLGFEARMADFGFHPKNGDLYMVGTLNGDPAPGAEATPFLGRFRLATQSAVWVSTFPWSSGSTCIAARLQELAFGPDGTAFASGSSGGGLAVASFREDGSIIDGTYPVWPNFNLSDMAVDASGGVYLSGIDNENLSVSKWASSGGASLGVCRPSAARERLCQDGLDNDADGLTDCGDPDCAQDAACQPPPVLPLKAYCYPNPFDARFQSSILHWELPMDSAVDLALFDPLGRTVRRWSFPAGSAGGRQGVNETLWDGTNESGESVRQGVYTLRVDAEGAGKKTVRVGVRR
jgi:hypothetical protein